MGLGFTVFLAGVAAAGYLGVKKLKEIEREIRQEARSVAEPDQEKRPSDVQVEPEPVPLAVETEEGLPLETRILQCLAGRQGMLQTELYDDFPEQDRKTMQGILLEMDRGGLLRREKEGSTYRLFVP
ncbi:hypothetical protein MJO47_10470 [Desulfuromonas sp. KJ2020]|uniref:hypothetical protein n=1 Tax=Desulfuromonas sp. KJ2020 TaxID=2919173 RepID=UPI0020A7904B|nr:hypothetical protein [Desulfuromonas sp. KJ2020]MCP3177525.1 hypothetical protein [Desulfuromonas sp. KJ2020]